ncbi:MAG: hypothetical protein HYT49_00705 [Candidatus Wildermuthbacteria bacterium]|nr:hypothetical protein [Candidatus Wildermuthbacteria bacterium]
MKRFVFAGGVGILLFIGVPFFLHSSPSVFAAVSASVGSYFQYSFSVDGTLDEAGSMGESWSPYWWLNSGGQFFLKDGVGKTAQGELPDLSKWRLYYASANPIDTDNGYHPQNIFRLVSRSTWQNFEQQVRFRITRINMSESPERDGWSGVLLFNRYVNGDNLYYAGIREDGYSVIKKKKNGVYYTLASERVYGADAPYDRDTNPNLIPGKKWIGLRSVVQNGLNGSVDITLYVDKNNTGVWEVAAQVTDDGKSYGGSAITSEGYVGVRTDFMDVEFDDYKVRKL